MRVIFIIALIGISGLLVSAQTPATTPVRVTAPIGPSESIPPLPKATNEPPKGGVVNGKAILLPKPRYPRSAVVANIGGVVSVQVIIDESGNVVSASAKSGHCMLFAAAEDAAILAKFSPTTLSGRPVKVTGAITYNFVPAASPTLPTSVNLELLSLGTLLTLSRSENIPSNWEQIKKMAVQDLPLNDEEIRSFKTINTETLIDERSRIIDETIKLSREKMTGRPLWKFELGINLGEILSEVKNVVEGSDKKVNLGTIPERLSRIKSQLSDIPYDFPPEVLVKLKKLISFSELPNLTSDDTRRLLFRSVNETFESISPSL